MSGTELFRKHAYIACFLAAVLFFGGCSSGSVSSEYIADNSELPAESFTLTNVSYDPTREFYAAYNEMFAKYYREKTGHEVKIIQSHGGSGGQARSVVEGADADVVTLALAHDITLIEQAGLIDAGWIKEFERDSSPYTSTIVFLVRQGNEKEIHDWDDLIREDVSVISPDPKSSGAACWNFLAAWRYADRMNGSDETKIKDFMSELYRNVAVMDSGARGATTTFVENGQGDVLVSWENEALQVVKEYPGKFEVISPSISILAQPSVAIVDENAAKNGTQELAAEYLSYLYSDEAQNLIAQYSYRPCSEKVLESFSDTFDLDMKLCTVEDFGGWDAAYEKFFMDGGVFDEIYSR